ncbi:MULTISPECIES: general secretion pathway protein GspK [unclassified Pseudoalteromonas]|uniref:general secretion pathway protein GspK n=1 Tax=unclassified Pseudoalteromonas TaxID=194690 RepID=UPI0005A8B7F6|nr:MULTISPECIES: type II secretion system protein GspK [unclassified Pseudoalteromonas]
MHIHKGIALVQVLIISVVLTLLSLFIAQTVQFQTAIAHTMNDAFKLRLQIEDAEARLLQTILTEHLYVSKTSRNEIVRKWNFYGKEFSITENVKISIQDLNGLISLNSIDKTITKSLLSDLGLSIEETNIFIDSLEDWKDEDDLKHLNGAESAYYRSIQQKGPRNGYLQSLSEVEYIKGADTLTFTQWQKYFSVEFVNGFNPLNSPETILKSIVKDDSKVKEVIELREEGKLTELRFVQITGMDSDEFISFSSGNQLFVTIEANNETQRIVKSFIVERRPRSIMYPIVLTGVKWNNM